jgi:hypothetical protein
MFFFSTFFIHFRGLSSGHDAWADGSPHPDDPFSQLGRRPAIQAELPLERRKVVSGNEENRYSSHPAHHLQRVLAKPPQQVRDGHLEPVGVSRKSI